MYNYDYVQHLCSSKNTEKHAGACELVECRKLLKAHIDLCFLLNEWL